MANKIFKKITDFSKEKIEDIRKLPKTKKEKELKKKQDEKKLLLLEREVINNRFDEISKELEIVESYIKIYTEELKEL